MVSSVNSDKNATRIGWHLWEIDQRLALGLSKSGGDLQVVSAEPYMKMQDPRPALGTLVSVSTREMRVACNEDNRLHGVRSGSKHRKPVLRLARNLL